MTVTRFYNNPQAGATIDAFGIGWTMHPGWLVISASMGSDSIENNLEH